MFSDERLDAVFDRTDGHCHLCHDSLNRGGYNKPSGWEVEHSVPRAKGGTDRLSNLYAAHVSCNRRKGVRSTRTVRQRYGYTKAPRSRRQREQAQLNWAMFGAFGIGSGMGYLIANAYDLRDKKRWLTIIGCGLLGSAVTYYAVTARS